MTLLILNLAYLSKQDAINLGFDQPVNADDVRFDKDKLTLLEVAKKAILRKTLENRGIKELGDDFYHQVVDKLDEVQDAVDDKIIDADKAIEERMKRVMSRFTENED